LRRLFAKIRVNELNGDITPLAERQCVSAHSSCGPLTSETKDEIIIFVGRNSRFARRLEAVVALLAHLFFLHHGKLPSAHSEFLRDGVNYATRGSVQETHQIRY
jgi:hypothetical protein